MLENLCRIVRCRWFGLIHFNKHELSLIFVVCSFFCSRSLSHNIYIYLSKLHFGLAYLQHYNTLRVICAHLQMSVHNHFDGCLFTNITCFLSSFSILFLCHSAKLTIHNIEHNFVVLLDKLYVCLHCFTARWWFHLVLLK